MNVNSGSGTTLPEACIALFISMVVITGCLTALQLGIKYRKTSEAKAFVLLQVESLAMGLQRLPRSAEDASGFYQATRFLCAYAGKTLLERFPKGAWKCRYQAEEDAFQILFSWKNQDPHPFALTVLRRGLR